MRLTLMLIVSISMLTACKEQLEPLLEQVKSHQAVSEVAQAAQQLSIEDMVEGIKQALEQGVGQAVGLLGVRDGFRLSNLYHIGIPEPLQDGADLLRKFGQGERVDEFETRLNLAAEDAVKQALPVFVDTIRQMSVEDAVNILQGPDDAATEYFRSNAGQTLNAKFLPIIEQVTNESGLSSYYKSFAEKLNKLSPKFADHTVDLDAYILDKANVALYQRVAVEEKAIRDEPLKRTTDILKKVFGEYGNSSTGS